MGSHWGTNSIKRKPSVQEQTINSKWTQLHHLIFSSTIYQVFISFIKWLIHYTLWICFYGNPLCVYVLVFLVILSLSSLPLPFWFILFCFGVACLSSEETDTSQKALVWDTCSQGLLPDICIVNDMASMVVTDSSSVESARNPRGLEINCVVYFNIWMLLNKFSKFIWIDFHLDEFLNVIHWCKVESLDFGFTRNLLNSCIDIWWISDP